MRIFTIEWADCEAHRVLAAFSSEADRDATFAAIEAIPWHEKPGYIGDKGWAERSVSFHEEGSFGDTWVRHNGIHGTIYKGSEDVLDAVIPVFDKTDRTPYVRRKR